MSGVNLRSASRGKATSSSTPRNAVHFYKVVGDQHVRLLNEFAAGAKPTTPNQYMLRDGRTFDAEESLYGARWLHWPPEGRAEVIPQRYG